MEQNIKPIETLYNGYRFRSRLEARWAVFFDSLDIQYEYEKEGFTLSDGKRYLPDFFLLDFGMFVEIKPAYRFPEQRGEYDAVQELAGRFRNDTGSAIAVFYGEPARDRWGDFYGFDLCDSGGGAYDVSCRFIDVDTCRDNGYVILQVSDYRSDRTIAVNSEFLSNKRVCNPAMIREKYIDYTLGELGRAMTDEYCSRSKAPIDIAKTAARQARFEYGEHGMRMAE